jgi:hypothetical protein
LNAPKWCGCVSSKFVFLVQLCLIQPSKLVKSLAQFMHIKIVDSVLLTRQMANLGDFDGKDRR